MKIEQIKLDVIPIYKNEMFPTKDNIWHICHNYDGSTIPKKMILEHLMLEIERKFYGCDWIVILEKGKVLEIIKG